MTFQVNQPISSLQLPPFRYEARKNRGMESPCEAVFVRVGVGGTEREKEEKEEEGQRDKGGEREGRWKNSLKSQTSDDKVL